MVPLEGSCPLLMIGFLRDYRIYLGVIRSLATRLRVESRIRVGLPLALCMTFGADLCTVLRTPVLFPFGPGTPLQTGTLGRRRGLGSLTKPGPRRGFINVVGFSPDGLGLDFEREEEFWPQAAVYDVRLVYSTAKTRLAGSAELRSLQCERMRGCGQKEDRWTAILRHSRFKRQASWNLSRFLSLKRAMFLNISRQGCGLSLFHMFQAFCEHFERYLRAI